uniref:Uncharacterized protein n=1 Tax=Klebsiella pneumoniae TaxID=573 RepID=A0A024HVF4_KLEPN|nr:hypothetical protein PENVA_0097 [Klebsiella pneumoniae]
MLLCRLRGKKTCSWWAKVSTSVNCGRNGPGSIVSALMYIWQDVAVHSGPSRRRRLPLISRSAFSTKGTFHQRTSPRQFINAPHNFWLFMNARSSESCC